MVWNNFIEPLKVITGCASRTEWLNQHGHHKYLDLANIEMDITQLVLRDNELKLLF